MREITWAELAASDKVYISSSAPEAEFLAAWELSDAHAVLLDEGANSWLGIEGRPTRLEYVRILSAASEMGHPVGEAALPTDFVSQLQITPVHRWFWMWRDEPLRALPMGCEIIADQTANAEIDKFLQANAPDAAVKPGHPEIQFWVVKRDEGGAIVATAAGTQWQTGAKVVASVGVSIDHRRQGLGAAVTQVAASEHFARGAKRVELGVRGSNAGAHAMYLKLGFDKQSELTSVKLA